jgi:hypothetical protein
MAELWHARPGAAGAGGNDHHRTECRARLAVPQRSRYQRAVFARGAGQHPARDTHPEYQRRGRLRLYRGRGADHPRRLRRRPLQPLDRRADRLHHAQHPLRADPHRQGRDHRRRADAEQAHRQIHQAGPQPARSHDQPGHAGPAKRPVHRAHAGHPPPGNGVHRRRLRGHRRHQARLAAAEGDGRGDAPAQCRTLDAVPQRGKDQRTVVGGRPGPGVGADPPAQPPRHRRRRIHLGQGDQHPLRLRRPALQPGLRQEDRLLHPLDPLRADHQQARQGDRRDAGAEQARRPVHRRGRIAPARLHRADIDRAGKRQAVRRRAEHEELQRGDAGVDVERGDHARRKRKDRHLQRRRPAHPARQPGSRSCTSRQPSSSPAAMPGSRRSSSASAKRRPRNWRWKPN